MRHTLCGERLSRTRDERTGGSPTYASGQILTDDTRTQLSSCPRKRAPRAGRHCVCGPWAPASAGATEKEEVGTICLVQTTRIPTDNSKLAFHVLPGTPQEPRFVFAGDIVHPKQQHIAATCQA